MPLKLPSLIVLQLSNHFTVYDAIYFTLISIIILKLLVVFIQKKNIWLAL